MKAEIGHDEDWETIESKLPSNWRDLATEHGILRQDKRRAQSGGSGWKIRDAAALLRMILHHATSGASLETTTALAAALDLATITGSALHKWMQKCGPWIAAMLGEMVSASSRFSIERWAGYEVIAVDATTAQMPGAKGSTSLVHYALRLSDLCAVGIEVTSNKVGESLRNFVLKEGQFWIADRGYCNANSVAHAIAAKADVLIRFAFGPMPLFDASGAALDLSAAVLAMTRPGAKKEWDVFVRPRDASPIAGRLIAVRLTEEQSEKSAARLSRAHGKSHVTKQMSDYSHFVMLFTTAPRDRMTAAELIELYQLRWQVELEFKRDKSIAGLGNLPNKLPETIYSWICTKMLALQLARRLAEPDEPFPPSIVGAYALRIRASQIAALARRNRA